MSHHPSSAELAAFRRRIYNTNSDLPDAWRGVSHDDDGRAWPDEREHGIGYRVAPDPGAYGETGYATTAARREASAMRSRAYARMDTLTCQQHGVRTWYVDGARLCWDCGRSCPAVDPFWDDDEPRKPLPVAYRNPIASA